MQDIGRVNVLKSSQYLVQKMLQNEKRQPHIMLYKNEDKFQTNAHYYGNIKQQ